MNNWPPKPEPTHLDNAVNGLRVQHVHLDRILRQLAGTLEQTLLEHKPVLARTECRRVLSQRRASGMNLCLLAVG